MPNKSTQSSIRDVLDSFRACTVLVVGDVMLDEYIVGTVNRVSPEAPVPVVQVERHSFFPGGAANAAANIASLGGTAYLIGVIGCDDAAQDLRDTLSQHRVRSALVEDTARPTTRKSRVVAQNQQVVRFDLEQRQQVSADIENFLLEKFRKWLPQADAVVISDYGKGALSGEATQEIIAWSAFARKPTIVDPKSEDFQRYRGSTVITPNVTEAERAMKREFCDDTTLELGALELGEMLGSAVLLTRGARGMSLFYNSEITHIAATAQNVFDVTGAGDTVVATFAICMAAGTPLKLAAEISNAAAAIAVRNFGTTAVRFDSLVEAVNRNLDIIENKALVQSAS
jgi:D-glycero-beta-D-manno-heptose-7-phosphate kinase